MKTSHGFKAAQAGHVAIEEYDIELAGGLDINVTKVWIPCVLADHTASVPESSGICTSTKARSTLAPFSNVRQSRSLSVVVSRSGNFESCAASVRMFCATLESSATSILIVRDMTPFQWRCGRVEPIHSAAMGSPRSRMLISAQSMAGVEIDSNF
jgi:hypothetical protein